MRDKTKAGEKKGIRLNFLIGITFIVSAILLAAAVGLFFYQRAAERQDRKNRTEITGMSEEARDRFIAWEKDADRIMDYLSAELLYGEEPDDDKIIANLEELRSLVSGEIGNLTLFSQDGEVILSEMYETGEEKESAREAGWFARAIENDETEFFDDPVVCDYQRQGDFQKIIPLIRTAVVHRNGTLEKAVLRLDLPYSSLKEALGEEESGRYTALLNPDGVVLMHPQQGVMDDRENQNLKEAAGKSGIFKNGSSYYLAQGIGNNGWVLVSVLKETTVLLPRNREICFEIMIILIFVGIVVLLNELLTHVISRPFRSLKNAVGQIEQEDMNVSIQKTGIREIDSLGDAITHMAHEISELIERVRKEGERKRKLEMDVLHAQINPHFLYNTLDVLVWMIENKKPGEAAHGVVVLSRFFRLSLARGRQVVPLKDEIEYIRSYLYIQNMGHQKFMWDIQTGEGTENLATIKLILQPIVENAITHGIEYMGDEGEIHVRTCKEGSDLYLTVIDNGRGMSKEQVAAVLSGHSQGSGKHSGIGVSNVLQRIQLYYGKEYGISIESEIEEGTKVTIHLPALPYEEEQHEKD